MGVMAGTEPTSGAEEGIPDDLSAGLAEAGVPEDLSAGLGEAARALFAAGDVNGTLARIATVAVETIEGCDFAGVYLVEGAEVLTPVSTGPVSDVLDALQKQLGEGPCLDAMAHRAPVYAEDLAETTPWPRFAPAAVEAGVRSIFALSLSANQTLGALNCYSGYPRAFGGADRARAVMLATLAALALSNAEERRAEDTRIADLEAGLVTRTVIGQAQGILMERERIGADQAFDILRRASQRLNVKLRDIAQGLVDTEEGRATGPQESPN